MNFNSINTSIAPSFIAFSASSEFLSDNELDQILNQPYEDTALEITTSPSSFDFPRMNDLLDFGPPPKLPLLPQFARIESRKTQETKKRKKEDEVLPTEVSADPTTKKKKTKPTKLTDRNIESMKNSDNRLINAIVDAIFNSTSKTLAAKECKISKMGIGYYVKNTQQLLDSPTITKKSYEHTSPKIVNAIVAKCQALLKADPSLKTNKEKEMALLTLRVDTLLQAMKHHDPEGVTDDVLKELQWGRRYFRQYVKEALRYAKDNIIPVGCCSSIRTAAIKYRALSKSPT